MGGQVFVSYSHEDGTYARSLVEHLQAQGIDAWIDEGVDFGDRWLATISAQIDTCAAFVLIMTPNAERSEWVEKEIVRAEQHQKPMIPLLLDGRPLMRVNNIQYEDVTGGVMPRPEFLSRLRDAMANGMPTDGDPSERDWLGRLRYEQQIRAARGSGADVDRRGLLPTKQPSGRSAYNLTMLLLAGAAVVLTVSSTNLDSLGRPGTDWWQLVLTLWPVWVLAIFAYAALPLSGAFLRASRERRGRMASYPYEFAFWLDELVEPARLRAHVSDTRLRRLGSALSRVAVISRGYGRIDRMAPDTTLVETRSFASLRVGALQYAQFDLINDILIRKVVNRSQYVLVRCRILGDSPTPLKDKEVELLLKATLEDLGARITMLGKLDAEILVTESISGGSTGAPV